MRGERASLRKSLLDVHRELKIKAAYISAIENADASAFETPGFIDGYVRSYARYLGLDPEWALDKFCLESGFGSQQKLFPFTQTETKPKISQLPKNQALLRVVKSFVFVIFYPVLVVFDVFNWIVSRATRAEPGSKLSFQSVSSSTTDWWALFSVCAAILAGVLFFFSSALPTVSDLPTRLLLTSLFAISIGFMTAWFNPKFFFARITLLLLGPMFIASVFGAEVQVKANGELFGGYLSLGKDWDPVETVVLGILCALAMLLHRRDQ